MGISDNKIIINGRFLTQRLTGVHRYAYELCLALYQLNFEFIVIAPNKILKTYETPFKVIKIGRTSSHLWEQVELPIYLNLYYRNATLINFTGLGTYFFKRNICTIHDLSFLANPSWFSVWYYNFYKIMTPLIAKKAIKIITVSEFSKLEIHERLKIDNEKIFIVTNAVSAHLVRSKKKAANGGYILSVSSIDPRKNFKRLIDAFIKADVNLKLIIVGKESKIFNNIKLEVENLSNIIFTGYITDNELCELYSNADFFIYPSLYEGFGIPNLEAMNNFCPVLTSNIAPHLEVCGDAAIYFDPENVDSIVENIKLVSENLELRNEMINKGIKRAEAYSWYESAKRIIEIIMK